MLSFGRRKSAKAGIRAALVAGATVAAIGLSAGSASASLSCEGSDIIGRGSSLQKVIEQNVWKVGFETGVCSTEPNTPTITYEPVGSGGGLEKWNHNGVAGSINTAYSFIGTDDAPTAAQITNMTGVSGGASLLTIPVAQTSIGAIASPPSGCNVKVITNKDLELVFTGKILKWSELSTNLASPNPACNFAIKRVVRLDGSGQTYQFKNYLYQINKLPVPCTTEGEKTWQELEPIVSAGKPNTVWPEDEGCATTRSALLRPPANGGGEVAKMVTQTSGSIGYASLPDMETKLIACEETSTCKNTRILSFQNNGKKKLSEATFASPLLGEEEANCLGTVYTVPTLAKRSTKVGSGLNADWSQVFGAKLVTGGFPLCTLTYNLAWNKYSGPGFTEGQEKTVNDYINEYIVQTAGQEGAATQFYAPLPIGETSSHNVLDAAKFAAAKIGF